MSFVAHCPACKKAVTISHELVGVIVACPHCRKHFTVSAEGSSGVLAAGDRAALSSPTAIVRFTFVCQRCDSALEGRSDLCGQPGSCPTCGALFVVPEIDPNTGQAAGPAIVADDGQFPTPMHAYATAGTKAPTIRRLDAGGQVVVCPRCRAEMPVEANLCASCGIPFTMEGAASICQQVPETNQLATVALVAGIVGVLTACQPVVGLAAAGLGIAAYLRAKKIRGVKSGRGLAIAGIILGLAAIGLFVAWRYRRYFIP